MGLLYRDKIYSCMIKSMIMANMYLTVKIMYGAYN